MSDLSQNRQIVGSPAGALAPCPFCGGDAVPDFIEDASYVIKCSACSTRSMHLASASIAIAAWNRRPVMPATAAVPMCQFEGYVDGEPLVKWFDRRNMPQAGDKLCVQSATTVAPTEAPVPVRTWRERIDVTADYPLDMPTDVERAMVAEIEELRALLQVQDEAKTAGDAGDAQNCRSSEKVQALQDDPRQMIVVGGQRLGKSILLDLQRDAARYRWLRDKADGMVCTAAPMVASLDDAGRLIGLIDSDELDAAVDVAMARPAERKRKTKRMGNDK